MFKTILYMDRILFVPKEEFDYYEEVELVINNPEDEIALEDLRTFVCAVLDDIGNGEDVECYLLPGIEDLEDLKGFGVNKVDGIYFTAEKWFHGTPDVPFKYYIVRNGELMYEDVMEEWV
jgi:hypothetical protein